MIAFQYPPMTGSSALARITRFVRYLPRFGWSPIVLTASSNCYESLAPLDESPENGAVHRVWAVDAKKAFGLGGRVPRRLALPDRWSSWWVGGVAVGLWSWLRDKPSVLWSSFPIATAHSIAATLQRLTGLPWVADFRDPMIDEDYPSDRLVRARFEALERRVAERASAIVFTTPGAMSDFALRHSGIEKRVRLVCIPNGFDEADFASAGLPAPCKVTGRITILHSGAIYPSERDPTALFSALQRLKDCGLVDGRRFSLVLRATGHDEQIGKLIGKHGLDDVVLLAPPVPHKKAIEEMLEADALLVLQAANCNRQVPAKLYEYLRCGRPIVGLTDEEGDTAALLRTVGVGTLAPLDDAMAIERVLGQLLRDLRDGNATAPDPGAVARYSRITQTEDLASVLHTAGHS